jgi:F0F1-type ATP synthase membrane subunit c/vacuolar-type H+-ATPase subunit K
VHLLVGLAAGAAGVPPALAVGAAVAFEIIETLHEHPRGSRLFGTKRPESPLNMASDFAAFGLGLAAGVAAREA